MNSSERINLDGKPVRTLRICIIGAGGFIGSHLCEMLMAETRHKVFAIDLYNDKIKHVLESETLIRANRIEFHQINIKYNSTQLEKLIRTTDLTINLASICTPAYYNTRPLDTIYSNSIDALLVVKYCSANSKRLIHFSSCEVYGKTIGSFLPKDHPLRQNPDLFVLNESCSPCIYGPIEKQRWSYACAKQLIERVIHAECAGNSLEFTIVRPFNWIGPRMDFIPGIDGPNEGVPRVLACFTNNLLRHEPLKLVDGGQSQRTFVYINDAIEAVLLMIENPQRASGHIFNVGNPDNEVTIKQLAEMMTEVYSNVSGEPPLEVPAIDVSSKDFYGEGYDDCDRRIPDMTLINEQLKWNPKTTLWDLLESTLKHQHRTYAEAIKQAIAKPVESN